MSVKSAFLVKWIKFGTVSVDVIEITEVHYDTTQLLSYEKKNELIRLIGEVDQLISAFWP